MPAYACPGKWPLNEHHLHRCHFRDKQIANYFKSNDIPEVQYLKRLAVITTFCQSVVKKLSKTVKLVHTPTGMRLCE